MAKTKAPKSEKRVRMSTRRSANFTHHEKLVLLSLMREYRHIVEDRHTDGVTVREKNTAWIDLTNTYNAESDVSTRSLKQLRQCWKNLKSRSRIDFLQDETGNPDMGTLTLLPAAGTTTSPKNDSTGSGNTLTLVTVGGISTSTTTNEGSETSNNASSIDNASTIILNSILTNNSNTIINNNSNSINSIPTTNGIASENMSSNSESPGLTNLSQSLPIATSAATNRQRPESKTSSSNKKRKKKAPTNPKAAVPTTAVAVDAVEGETQEVSRQRRKTRPTLVHLDYDENGVLEDGGKTAETERPRRKTRPSVMHMDYDISTVDDDEDDVNGAVVADEDVSDRLHVNVAYPDDAAMVVSQSGHSQDADDVYPSDTLAVVSVSGSADRIHFNSHVSTPDSDHVQPHEVNLHPQPQTTTYRLTHPNTTSTNHNHHPLQIQQASFQPSSNHLQPDEHTTGSEHDIKVFDSIRGFGKVLHTQNALPTHLVSHVTDGHTVHSVNLGPSINYSGSVDIINNVPPSHAAPHIVPAHGANSSHIPSIEPVLLEKVTNNEEPAVVDFHKTEHSERMRNIRLERRLIGIEHKARMELIKLKSEYIKMKMEVLIHDRS